jgi:electron transfer flavoprotein alpha subunit
VSKRELGDRRRRFGWRRIRATVVASGLVLAVIPVRDGTLPAGALEAANEAGDRVVLVGSGTGAAATALGGEVRLLELGDYAPGRWSRALIDVLADEPTVLLPNSPDGRDLAPRLAASLDRPLLAGAVRLTDTTVVLARGGGMTMHTLTAPPTYVATLQVGVRGELVSDTQASITVVDVAAIGGRSDAVVERIDPPDAATIDLAEASRIVGGGAGLDSAERFTQLASFGASIGASIGATRVITDRSWIEHDRQIGTTGVVVAPTLYLAFGISGAVQHTSGLGSPEHVISVNTDAHCPMMQLADLAVVADANATLDELVALLGAEVRT